MEVLTTRGFIYNGNKSYYNPKYNIELNLSYDDKIKYIIIPDIDQPTLDDWLFLNDQTLDQTLILNLFNWVQAQRNIPNPGFISDENTTNVDNGKNDQHNILKDLHFNTDREILIYTRGKAIMPSKPKKSQSSFNACVLDCRGSDINLKKMTGKTKIVQQKLLSCYSLPRWLKLTIDKIETNNYHTIDIFCTKGRHRSVGVAELIKKLYYPNAKIQHLML